MRDGDYTSSSGHTNYCACVEGEHTFQNSEAPTFTWTQSVLPKSKYYTAVGLVVDGVLSRILDHILAISDIPEVESHKLSELCRILTALEGLFVEDTSEVSMCSVTCVVCSSVSRSAFVCCVLRSFVAQVFLFVRTFGMHGSTFQIMISYSPFRKRPWRI